MIKKKVVYNLYVDGSYSPEKNIYGWGIAVYNRKELIYTYKGIGVRGIAIKNIAGEKSPSTKMAILYLVSTISGLPGRS